MKNFFVKLGKDLKESFRKLIVSLKRRPHNIAFVMLLVSFVQYSFNLTDISNTTAQLMRQNMGLYSFVIMLFTTLPKRTACAIPAVLPLNREQTISPR